MSDGPDLRSCIESPDLLIQFCHQVIDQLHSRQQDGKLIELDKQNYEISITIKKLEKAGIPVPDELHRLKTDLEAKLSIPDEVADRLELLVRGFEDLKREIRFRTRRPSRVVTRNISVEPTTSREVLREEIIRALQILGGAGHAKQVRDEIEKRLDEKLFPRDLEMLPEGTLVWHKNTRRERGSMVKEGILKKDSAYGVWELNPEYE